MILCLVIVYGWIYTLATASYLLDLSTVNERLCALISVESDIDTCSYLAIPTQCCQEMVTSDGEYCSDDKAGIRSG